MSTRGWAPSIYLGALYLQGQNMAARKKLKTIQRIKFKKIK